MKTPISVLLFHKSKLLCEVLRESLEQRNYHVLSYYNSGSEVLEKVKTHSPEIVIISNSVNDIKGIQVLEEIEKVNLSSKVLFLSQNDQEIVAVERMKTVLGHIHAYDGMSEMFFALQELVSGRKYVSPSVELVLRSKPKFAEAKEKVNPNLLERLTPREKEIMQALSKSFTTPQIAEQYKLSPATVNNHRANIMQKLKLRGRNQLMSLAVSLRPYYFVNA